MQERALQEYASVTNNKLWSSFDRKPRNICKSDIMSDRQILPEQLAALTQVFPDIDDEEEELQTVADLLGVDLDNVDVRVEFSDAKFQVAYSSCKYRVTAQLAYLKLIKSRSCGDLLLILIILEMVCV